MGTAVKDGITIDEALNRAGFGLYSYLLISLTGLTVTSLVFTVYGNVMIVPISACELMTTSAQKGFLAATPIIGFFIGSFIWGYLADVFGRKSMLTVSLVSAATVNALASISVNWIMLIVLQFCTSCLASGQYPVAMAMLSESVPIAKKNFSVIFVASIFLLSQGIMAVIAIPIIPLTFSYELPTLGIYWNSWRTLLLMFSAPSIISALWLSFMFESPGFLFAKGRLAEAKTVLKKIHNLNHFQSKEEFNVKYVLLETSSSNDVCGISVKNRIVPLFKAPLLKNTIILSLLFLFQQVGAFQVWLPTIFNGFVEIINTGEGSNLTLCSIITKSLNAPLVPDEMDCSLNVPSLLIVIVVAALQSSTNTVISIVVNRTGRRNVVIFLTALCGLSGIVVNLIPDAIGSTMMFLIFINGIVTFGLYTAMTVAYFPTHLRSLAVGLMVSGSRVSLFLSVQILNNLLENNCEVGFYVFTTIFASSAIIATFLPDDRSSQNTIDYKTTK